MSAWFVGADPASSLAGMAALREESTEIRTLELTVKRGDLPHRLSALRSGARAFLAELGDDGVWCVAVERPITRHGGASLLGAYGVFLEVAATTLPDVAVLSLMPAEVDLAAHGRGIASKDRKARSMVFARSLGYAGPSQDVADAVTAAAAGRALTLRALEDGER